MQNPQKCKEQTSNASLHKREDTYKFLRDKKPPTYRPHQNPYNFGVLGDFLLRCK